MAKGPAHLEVRRKEIPEKTAREITEMLISKFIKKTSKENLLKFLYEKSAKTRRYTKPSKLEKDRRQKAKRIAKRNNLEEMGKEPEKK